jgi:predicted transport protein
MRKLICMLTVFSLAFGMPASAATKKKTKTKTSAPSYEALKQRLMAYDAEVTAVYSQKDPNLKKLLTFVYSKTQTKYRDLTLQYLADGLRLFETRSVPIDVKKVVSIRPISKGQVSVDFCHVSSKNFFQSQPAIDEVKDLRGSRDEVIMVVSKGAWYVNTVRPGAEILEVSQCADAQ